MNRNLFLIPGMGSRRFMFDAARGADFCCEIKKFMKPACRGVIDWDISDI